MNKQLKRNRFVVKSIIVLVIATYVAHVETRTETYDNGLKTHIGGSMNDDVFGEEIGAQTP